MGMGMGMGMCEPWIPVFEVCAHLFDVAFECGCAGGHVVWNQEHHVEELTTLQYVIHCK